MFSFAVGRFQVRRERELPETVRGEVTRFGQRHLEEEEDGGPAEMVFRVFPALGSFRSSPYNLR